MKRTTIAPKAGPAIIARATIKDLGLDPDSDEADLIADRIWEAFGEGVRASRFYRGRRKG